MSTLPPTTLGLDALVLPWGGGVEGRSDSPTLEAAGEVVLQEIAEYRGQREVMLTSAGILPSRFLFHLSLPEEEQASAQQVEDLLRDCFFQASVLGIRELAIALQDFSVHVASFSELVSRVWETCREFMARDRGPRLILLLVDDRDLRGQYLRHFLDRKEAEDKQWDRLDEVAVAASPSGPRPRPRADRDTPRRVTHAEQVLNLELPDIAAGGGDVEAVLGDALDTLLADYHAGRGLSEGLARLGPTMAAVFADAVSENEDAEEPLSERLRVLGGPLTLRLPWELLREEDSLIFLGESHLFTRGTNFLHFRRRGRRAAEARRLSLRVMGETPAAQALAGTVQEMVIARDLDLNWSPPEIAGARLVHCLDATTLRGLLDEEDPSCELVFADLPAGETYRPEFEVGETARALLGRGCRHVLAPLAPFRSSGERDAFRAAFYERLLAGAPPGEALHYAQRVLMEAHGADSGWWLYRLYGQTDSPLLPGARRPVTERDLTPVP